MKTLYILVFLLFEGALLTQAQTIVTVNGSTSGTPTVYIGNGLDVYLKGGMNIVQGGSGAGSDYLQNNGIIHIVSDPAPGQSDFTNNVTGLQTYTTGQTTGEVIFAADNETQSITGGGSVKFMNLTTNNTLPPTLTLGQNVTVEGALTIGGIIKTQSSNLTLSSSGSLAGSPFSSANMIQADGAGKFIRGINSGAGSYTFPVGDATPNYSPVVLNFSSNSASGTVGINVTNSTEPNNNTPSPPAAYLSRYWTFSNSLSNYSYTGTFTYPSANINGVQSSLYLSRWTGSSWFEHTGSSAASNVLTINSALNQSTAALSGNFTGRHQQQSCPDMIGGTATPSYSIICTNTNQLLTTNGSGGTLQWQSSADNISWSDVSGATNATYTTPNGNGAPFSGAGSKAYFRCLVKNPGCFNVSSTSVLVEVSNPSLTVTVDSKTDNSITLDWSPVGGGNYDIDYDGTSSGSGSSVTPPYTISGLTASGNYNITVTQTGLSCNASGTLTGVKTLCAVPTGVTLSSPANKKLQVDWNGDAGDYRVYYRALAIQNAYSFKDVTTVNNNGTITITVPYDGTTYEVYVVRRNCPNPGDLGQKSALYNTIVKPLSACAPAAVINNVISTCPGQIEVSMSNSPTGNYVVYIQRLTPTVAGAVKYNVSGGTFQIHVGQAGQTFAVGVASKCMSGIGNIVMWPGGITIKPLCNPIGNLVLSNPTCRGFTASWNREVCTENTVNTYQLFMKRVGTLTWNSYPVSSPIAPISPYQIVNWLGKGYVMDCYVKANYICNGYVIGGPSSTVQTITTLSAGCREEGEEMLTPERPSTQIIAVDNSEAISIYPNPNNGQFQLDISRMSNEQQQVMIEVMNVLGQTVLTRISEVKDGHGNEIITLPETAAAGTYFVRVTSGNNVYTVKVNVSR